MAEDQRARYTAILESLLASHLRVAGLSDYDKRREFLDGVAGTLLEHGNPMPVHRYVESKAGPCRLLRGGVPCGLPADDPAHVWPFEMPDPERFPERTWHVRRWHIGNPAAPAATFDDINPVKVESWDREDDGTTGNDVVTWWPGRFSAFYGGWDGNAVAAAWQADRDRLAAAGGFIPLPLGPQGRPDDELNEPPHECASDCYCWE